MRFAALLLLSSCAYEPCAGEWHPGNRKVCSEGGIDIRDVENSFLLTTAALLERYPEAGPDIFDQVVVRIFKADGLGWGCWEFDRKVFRCLILARGFVLRNKDIYLQHNRCIHRTALVHELLHVAQGRALGYGADCTNETNPDFHMGPPGLFRSGEAAAGRDPDLSVEAQVLAESAASAFGCDG